MRFKCVSKLCQYRKGWESRVARPKRCPWCNRKNPVPMALKTNPDAPQGNLDDVANAVVAKTLIP